MVSQHRATDPALYETSLLSNLAGNAFSAFACTPMLLAGLALAGADGDSFPAAAPRTPEASTRAGWDSDES